MLAESAHSVADTGNEALLLLGARLARPPPDRRHPLGYGRNVCFWAFMVSILLFEQVGEAIKALPAGRHFGKVCSRF
jgi:divalent metal cation (Fe/Co/Zn/Cd) transporter